MTHVLSAVAWPYANGPRHIGHVAGFGVPSDVFSRYMRMAGHDVLMVSGTDEHGTPILVAADKEGVTAQRPGRQEQRGDRRRTSSTWGCPTTSSPAPRPATTTSSVQEMFRAVRATATWSSRRRRPRSARRPAGPCPTATSRAPARSAGTPRRAATSATTAATSSTPTELINPRSKINGETPEFVETQHYFLDLPALADALGEWLDEREAIGHLAPQRHQVHPEHPQGDPAARDDPRHRLGHPGAGLGGPARPSGSTSGSTPSSATSRPPSSGPGAPATPRPGARWWNDPEALSYYFMGKDNIVFHSQIWPAELLAYNGQGDRGGEPGAYGDLNLPTEVVSSEYLTMGDQQFSSSRGHVLYVGDFLARYGPDALRYFICAAGPETSDAAFTWADFVHPQQLRAGRRLGQPGQPHRHDDRQELRRDPARRRARGGRRGRARRRARRLRSVGDLIGRHRLRAAMAEAMRIVGEVNKYLTVTEPYKMKDESQRERLAHRPARRRAVRRATATPSCRRSCRTRPTRCTWCSGGEGELRADAARSRQVDELDPDNGAGLTSYPVITGDYSATPALGVAAGGAPAPPVEKPTPVFTKLDPRSSTRSSPASAHESKEPVMVLHPQARLAVEASAAVPPVWSPGYDIAAARAADREAALAGPREDVAEVDDVDADGVPCRLYRPDGRPAARRAPARRRVRVQRHRRARRRGPTLANRAGTRRAQRRLPPAARAPLPGCPRRRRHRARLAGARGRRPGPTYVHGDSAGGNLALVAALRHPGRFAAVALTYPFLDPTAAFESYRTRGRRLRPRGGRAGTGSSTPRTAADLADPDLAPLLSDRLGTLPPTLVVTAEHDPLRDEGEHLAQRLAEAGRPGGRHPLPRPGPRLLAAPDVFDAAEPLTVADRGVPGVPPWLRTRPRPRSPGSTVGWRRCWPC